MRDRPNHAAALAAAVIGVLAAWGARWLLRPLLGEHMPFITYFPMVFVLAWWNGFWPTCYATAPSILVLGYAILEPLGSFYIQSLEYRFGLAVYLVVALATGWLGEKFHLARRERRRGFDTGVAVSGYGQPEDRQRSSAAGFDSHLVKPVHQDKWISVLQRCAERQAVAM